MYTSNQQNLPKTQNIQADDCANFDARNMGIKFVQFDEADNPVSEKVVPATDFLKVHCVTSEQYLSNRSLNKGHERSQFYTK